MTKHSRTDSHRPSAIVPADYRYVQSYSLPHSGDGYPMPSWGVNCEAEIASIDDNGNRTYRKHQPDGQCCVLGRRNIARVTFAATGGLGNCSICGARYIHGDVWVHEPTGEHIHVGHDCAEKYELLADRSSYELEMGRRDKALAIVCERNMKAEQRQLFLDAHPGLEEALKIQHSLIASFREQFTRNCKLSDKQVAVALSFRKEAIAPRPRQEEKHIDAPEGRVTFEGEVVSIKDYESAYGVSHKMTLKVHTPAGSWLAWVTMPSSLYGKDVTRGSRVEVTATLKRGRDPHFALGKRPLAKVLPKPEAGSSNVA